MLSKHRFRILAALVVAAAILMTPQLAEAGSGTGASPAASVVRSVRRAHERAVELQRERRRA